MESSIFFRYRTGNSILHKANPSLKVFLSLFLSAFSFWLPVRYSALLFMLAFLLSVFVLHSTMHELFSDLKPTFVYAALLFVATIFLNAAEYIATKDAHLKMIFTPNATYLPLFFSTAAALQTTSLLYRSTSAFQISESISVIEKKITKNENAPISKSLSLALSFIPRIAQIWTRLENAWKARAGKNSPKKIATLVPFLFHEAMRNAFEKSLALENRLP